MGPRSTATGRRPAVLQVGLPLLLAAELVVGLLLGLDWVHDQQRREFAEGFKICFRVGRALRLGGQPFESETSKFGAEARASYRGVAGEVFDIPTDRSSHAGRGCQRGFAAVERANLIAPGEPDPFYEW